MTPRWIAPLAIAASLGAGVASAGVGGGQASRVGVIVDLTRGPDAAAVRAARADVASLRERGVDAELRVTHSPSESVAVVATLATRGARTLITRGVDEATVLAPLHDVRPGVRVVRR
jgi:hypothetical protein